MRKLTTVFLITIFIATHGMTPENENMIAEETLPYAEIPAPPANYTPQDVAARMIDGLGFRYHWATDDLRPEDLIYNPGNDGRTTEETLDHIYDLSVVIANVAKKAPTDRSGENPRLPYKEKRKQTLENLKTASDLLKENKSLEEFKIIFKKGDEISEHPFWNIINGMITDAIWHTGQVVSYRRSSGNPIRPGVNYFSGTVTD